MFLRKVWNYLKSPAILNGVVANGVTWLFALILGIIGAFIYSTLRSINFLQLAKDILNYKATILAYILFTGGTILLGVLFRFVSGKIAKNRVLTSAKIFDSGPEITIVPVAPSQEKNVFNSDYAKRTAFEAYGEKEWEPVRKQLIGNAGSGDFKFDQGIITLERSDIQGRYIIKIKGYYYNDELRSYITKNLDGNNPRYFKVSFGARSLRGQHKVAFTFQRFGTHVWLSNPEHVIGNSEWVVQNSSVAIKCHEDVVIELQIFEMGEEPGILQIKNIIVTED